VVVFTGLINLLGSTEELAAVVAHETGHVLARHHAERMSTMSVFSILKILVYALFQIRLPQAGLMLGVFLPYSRVAEHEADSIGLQLMAKACFDPGAMPNMLAKLHKMERTMEGTAAVPAFLRTHPLTNVRVDKVMEQLPKAYETYQEAGCGRVANSLRQHGFSMLP